MGLAILPPPTSAFMVQQLARNVAAGDWRLPAYRWVPADRISPQLALAVIAAEDQRFPTHFGLDLEAIRRAADHNARGGRTRGASTITQQTVKNLFLWPGRSWLRKGLEAWLALWMEALLSKGRILELYLNLAQFGDNVYGAEAASRYYFGVPADHLDARQAALLAAVLPNPVRYRADAPTAYVRSRQDWILTQMRQLGPESLRAVRDP
jgi:monofunctional biosynthetic peptidoglycan transglycosylase